MEYHPPLHLGVVAIEKEAFGSPSAKVAYLTFSSCKFSKQWKNLNFVCWYSIGKKYCSSKAMAYVGYSDSAPSETTVRRRYTDFKRGRTDTNDAERSGCPNSAVVPESTIKLHKLILEDRKLKLCEIAEEMKISESSVFTILHEHLSMRKLCSKWVLRLSQSIKNNNTSTIQSVVCNCLNTTKKSFCVNIGQSTKHGSITSLQSQIGF